MESKKYNNVFFVNDMTSLRYAVPFINAADRLLQHKVKLAFDSKSTNIKYNSIVKCKKRFDEIIERHEIEVIDASQITHVRSLFCVENVTCGLSSDVTYSFQHGFDYVNLHKVNCNSVYLMTDEHYMKHVKRLGNSAKLQPYPVSLWDFTDTIVKAKEANMLKDRIVTMFYPEVDSHAVFKEIYEYVTSKGYEIYVKQRAKNQMIPTYVNNPVYDNIWYPSESIMLPIISDFCIGFGTSAYTDLVHLNRQFIDLSIPPYSKKYHKPSNSNFYTIGENYLEELYTLPLHDVTVAEKSKQPFEDSCIKHFLQEILT